MKVAATDIGQMASASEVIFDALRAAIVDGSLRDGEVLRQDSIAKLFNVSRIPVLQAITRLKEQGLVEVQRYRGAVVASLSIEEIAEIFQFRALVEPEVVRLSIQNISKQTLALAARSCEAFSIETDSSKWGTLNREFHYSLYRDCRRPYYLEVANAALDRIDRYLRAQLVLTDGMARARREHAGILDACIAADADQGADLVRQHIIGAGQSLIDFLKCHHGKQAASRRASGDRMAAVPTGVSVPACPALPNFPDP